MTSHDFLSWMQITECRYATDVARKVGVSRDVAQRWLAAAMEGREVNVKRAPALAMAALAAGLGPWGAETETSNP